MVFEGGFEEEKPGRTYGGEEGVCVASMFALGKEGCVVRETKAEKAAEAGL